MYKYMYVSLESKGEQQGFLSAGSRSRVVYILPNCHLVFVACVCVCATEPFWILSFTSL